MQSKSLPQWTPTPSPFYGGSFQSHVLPAFVKSEVTIGTGTPGGKSLLLFHIPETNLIVLFNGRQIILDDPLRGPICSVPVEASEAFPRLLAPPDHFENEDKGKRVLCASALILCWEDLSSPFIVSVLVSVPPDRTYATIAVKRMLGQVSVGDLRDSGERWAVSLTNDTVVRAVRSDSLLLLRLQKLSGDNEDEIEVKTDLPLRGDTRVRPMFWRTNIILWCSEWDLDRSMKCWIYLIPLRWISMSRGKTLSIHTTDPFCYPVQWKSDGFRHFLDLENVVCNNNTGRITAILLKNDNSDDRELHLLSWNLPDLATQAMDGSDWTKLIGPVSLLRTRHKETRPSFLHFIPTAVEWPTATPIVISPQGTIGLTIRASVTDLGCYLLKETDNEDGWRYLKVADIPRPLADIPDRQYAVQLAVDDKMELVMVQSRFTRELTVYALEYALQTTKTKICYI